MDLPTEWSHQKAKVDNNGDVKVFNDWRQPRAQILAIFSNNGGIHIKSNANNFQSRYGITIWRNVGVKT